MTHSDSYPTTAISRVALFDELVKIGEAAEDKHKELKNALKHIAAGTAGIGLGTAAGYGVTELAPRFFKAKKPVYPKGSLPHKAITLGLPIATGLGATLWSRYRQKMNERMRGSGSNDGG
jgi:hypothetical protein